MSQIERTEGTALEVPKDIPANVAYRPQWMLVTTLVRNGVGFLAAFGFVSTGIADQLVGLILAVITILAIVVTEMIGLVKSFSTEKEINAENNHTELKKMELANQNQNIIENFKIEQHRLNFLAVNQKPSDSSNDSISKKWWEDHAASEILALNKINEKLDILIEQGEKKLATLLTPLIKPDGDCGPIYISGKEPTLEEQKMLDAAFGKYASETRELTPYGTASSASGFVDMKNLDYKDLLESVKNFKADASSSTGTHSSNNPSMAGSESLIGFPLVWEEKNSDNKNAGHVALATASFSTNYVSGNEVMAQDEYKKREQIELPSIQDEVKAPQSEPPAFTDPQISPDNNQ